MTSATTMAFPSIHELSVGWVELQIGFGWFGNGSEFFSVGWGQVSFLWFGLGWVDENRPTDKSESSPALFP